MKIFTRYLKQDRARAILAPLFKMLEAAFELLIPLVMAGIINRGIGGGDRGYILRMGLLMIALGLIGLTCSVTAQYFSAKCAMRFGANLRRDLFSHIETLSYTEIDRLGSATLITRMTGDVNQMQTGVNLFLRLFMRSPFIVLGATFMAWQVDHRAGRVFLIALPILTVIVFTIMFVSIPLYKDVQGHTDRVLQKTRENLAGSRVIRAFGQEEREKDEFSRETEVLTKRQLFVGRITSLLNPMTYVVINLSIAVIIWVGGKQVDLGILKQGEVYALVNYMSQILVELVKLANLIITETKAIACGRRVADVLSVTSSQQFPDEECGDLMPSDDAPAIEFNHVTFSYSGSGAPAIEDVSFRVERGETLGIIGGTGSGKSTLVNLIPRFYDATEGEILVEGIPVASYPKKKLRDMVGVVPQKAVLFAGSIAENLRLGNSEATDEELREALSVAQSDGFVSEKEGGLSYHLVQGAKNLSGGQKQRLTIARALVKKPKILILDDSSSALDYATDAALRVALREKLQDMTVVVVSQRTASIMHADKILVLDDGSPVGFGDHASLLSDCEVYREIYASQNQGEEVDAREAGK